jgi:hypothetical protein
MMVVTNNTPAAITRARSTSGGKGLNIGARHRARWPQTQAIASASDCGKPG